MKRLFSFVALAMLLVAIEPVAPRSSLAHAQSNDNDYTPLNSRIRRDRPFPLETRNWWQPGELTDAQRERSRNLVNVFSKCLWDRGNERALDLLEQTDFGFVTFEQIGLENSEAPRRYSFSTCLRRVARYQNSGVVLRFTAAAMRRWLLSEAYFDRFPDGASWVVPGNVIDERRYPLSESNTGVHVAMDFADCVIAQDPHGADFLFRTSADSEAEGAAIAGMMPALSACIPEGAEMEFTKFAIRQWIGEGLWHASSNSSPAPTETPQEAQ